MLLSDYQDHLNKGEYHYLLNQITQDFKYPKINEIENIYDFLNPFIEFSNGQVEILFTDNKSSINEIIESYQVKLAEELMSFILKSLVLEIQIKKIELTIKETDPKKRLMIYLYELLKSKDSYHEFFEIYEYLLVMILKRIYYSINNLLLMKERFDEDRQMIKKEFNLKDDQLVNIAFNLGDSHNDGLAVLELKFPQKSIIYKPRDNEIGLVASDVLNLLINDSDYKGEFFPKIINGENYCWEEKIEYLSCESIEEVQSFYRNFGFIAGYVYLLNGTDYHYENIIARKEFPVLVDNETLMHPELYNYLNVPEDYIYNIISTSLFPNPVSAFNLSALTGDEDITDHQIETLINIDNDNIGFANANIDFPSQKNIPKVLDKKVSLNKDNKKEILNGLKKFYETIINRREYLLGNQSPFQKLNGIKVRVLIKHTMNYHEILLKSTHPDHIKKKETQIQFISKNLKLLDEKVLQYEISSISNFDIPVFYTYTNNKNIYTGDDCLTDLVINTTSFDRLMEKISTFSFEDLELQKKIIQEVW